jgi:hypothetical protein
MEFIGKKYGGKAQVFRASDGFRDNLSWPELGSFVQDMSLPIGEPLVSHDPRFVFEDPFFKSGTVQGPDFTQSLWGISWVTPLVRYDTRGAALPARNVDYFVDEVSQDIIPYMISQMNSIGRTDFEYAIENYTWGRSLSDPIDWDGSPDGYNTFLFWNRPEERPSVLNGYNFGMWSKNGIDNNVSWDDEFYSKLKDALTGISFKSPYFCHFRNELGIDLYPGNSVYPISGTLAEMPCINQYTANDLGYMSCALGDPLSSDASFLIDGQRTFQEFWNEAVHRDGGDWPCLDFSEDEYERTPKAFEGFWRSTSLYRKANAYCLWKGGCEPALTYFPNMIFANSLALGSPGYVNPVKFGVQNTNQRALSGYSIHSVSPVLTNLACSPSFYNLASDDFDLYANEDLTHTYNTTLSNIDPRIATFKNYMTYDFVNYYPSDFTDWNWFRLQHMRRGMHNLVRSCGTLNPPCPWLSAWGYRNNGSSESTITGLTYDRNNAMCAQFREVWIETLKYAISIGIRQFGVFEEAYDEPTMSFWYDVLSEVKDWYDNTFKNKISVYQ